MGYREESAQLARELAFLAASGGSVDLDARGVVAAVTARREVLMLAGQVLAEARGGTTHTHAARGYGPERAGLDGSGLRGVQELEAQPVLLLARALKGYPAPSVAQDPGERDAAALASPVGQAWSQVGRRALLAGHEWSTRAPVLDGAQAWSAVADVAALAQALVVVDGDLRVAAARARDLDPGVQAELQRTAASGLRVAAGEAAAVAAAGDLPPYGDPGVERSPTRVLLVGSPQDVAAAQTRVRAQVGAVSDLGPGAVAVVATGQARVLSTAAVALAGVDPERAGRARHLAGQLTGAVAGARRLAALAPDDPRPVAQTRELVTHLVAVEARGWGSPAGRAYLPALAAVVDRAPAVVQALSAHADRALRTGRWLVVDVEARRSRDPLWRRATRADPQPAMVAALDATAAYASTLAAPGPVVGRGPGPQPPRQTLAQVSTLVRRSRPAQPGLAQNRHQGAARGD